MRLGTRKGTVTSNQGRQKRVASLTAGMAMMVGFFCDARVMDARGAPLPFLEGGGRRIGAKKMIL